MDSKIDEIGLGKYARRGNEKQAKTPKKISWGSIDATLLKIEMKVWRTGGLFVVSGTTKGLKGIQRVEKIPINQSGISFLGSWDPYSSSSLSSSTDSSPPMLYIPPPPPPLPPRAATIVLALLMLIPPLPSLLPLLLTDFLLELVTFSLNRFFDQLSIDQTTSITQRSWT